MPAAESNRGLVGAALAAMQTIYRSGALAAMNKPPGIGPVFRYR